MKRTRIRAVRCFLILATLFSVGGSCLAAQLRGGDLVVIDPLAHVIVKVDPNTGDQTLISNAAGLARPLGGCLDAAGSIVLADFGTSGPGGIYRVNPETGAATLISNGGVLEHPNSVAVDSAGNLIVTQLGGPSHPAAVLKVNPVTGQQEVIASGPLLSVPESLIVEADGNFLVSNYQNGTAGSSILRVNSTTGAISMVSAGGLLDVGPLGIAPDPHNEHGILVAQGDFSVPGAGQLVAVDSLTGAQSVVSSGLMIPTGVTQHPSGDVYLADSLARQILRIDRDTGDQTVISSAGLFTSPWTLFAVVPEPSGLALGALGLIGLTALGWQRSYIGLRSRQPAISLPSHPAS